jgi:hypothetical protein
MPKVTITASPRQGYRGFGAIERYFLSEQSETLDVTDAELEELEADPAKFFLKVEDAAADEPSKPTAKRDAEMKAARAAAKPAAK